MILYGSERRDRILKTLRGHHQPVSGRQLAEKLSVSRQVIVQDIALLRQAGHQIQGTSKGYILEKKNRGRLIKVRHQSEESCQELLALVDLGVEINDVIVSHRVYGKISAPLEIRNRRDVKQFRQALDSGVSYPLLKVTDGYHYHYIYAEDETLYDEAKACLENLGYWQELTEEEVKMLS